MIKDAASANPAGPFNDAEKEQQNLTCTKHQVTHGAAAAAAEE
jgi:hypothetical protein